MPDLQIIRIDDAKAQVRVGVPAPERATPQEVRISVTLALAEPPAYAAAEDRIGATVDYDRIIHFIRDDLGAPAHLIETLADRVGMTHPGLLYYFGTKQRLLLDVVSEREQRETSALLGTIGDGPGELGRGLRLLRCVRHTLGIRGDVRHPICHPGRCGRDRLNLQRLL